MCTVAGYTGTRRAAEVLLEMMRRQEGFASGWFTGIATIHEGKLHWAKVIGDVDTLCRQSNTVDLPGTTGIMHSRPDLGGDREWAHPFVDGDEENFAYLADGHAGFFKLPDKGESIFKRLRERGATFHTPSGNGPPASDGADESGDKHFDGSELKCQLIADYMRQGHPIDEAIRRAFQESPGEVVGLVVDRRCPDQLFAARISQPLMAGANDDGMYLATTALAFGAWPMDWIAPVPVNTIARVTATRLEERPLLPTPGPVCTMPPWFEGEARMGELLHRNRSVGCRVRDFKAATNQLWPKDQAPQKDMMVYEILRRWHSLGKITWQRVAEPHANPAAEAEATSTYFRITPARTGPRRERAAATFREATPEDIKAIVEITREAFGPMSFDRIREAYFGEKLGGKSWDEYKCEAVAQHARAHPERFIVAEVDGRVVGYGSFYLDEKRGVATIGNNAVVPEFQGRGIASAMQLEVLDRFTAAGYTRWQVSTPAHDHAAQRVYEKLGFEEAGRSVLYLCKAPPPSASEAATVSADTTQP